MTTKKKTAAKPATTKASPAALPTHDGTDTVDQAAQDGRAARMATMEPDAGPKARGQTATVSKASGG